MKLGLLLLGLLTSAAVAATSDTRFDLHALWGAEPSPPPAMMPVNPPWLTSNVELPTELQAEHDPHAAYHAHDVDPHAAYPADNPHAAYHADDPHSRGPATTDIAPVEPSRAANGRTVAALFAERAAWSGKQVRVRATVVKLTDGILGKTYLHLQDGSGSLEGHDNDLTATTTELFELGETVEVEGQLALDQDVGIGYVYDVLLTQVGRVGPR
jgi:hypothetical protein